jgi:hypothetical protein
VALMLMFLLFYSFVLKAMSLKYQNVTFAQVDVDSSKVKLRNPLRGPSDPKRSVTAELGECDDITWLKKKKKNKKKTKKKKQV